MTAAQNSQFLQNVDVPIMVNGCRHHWDVPASTYVDERVDYKRTRLDRHRATRDAVERHITGYLRDHYADLCQLPGSNVQVVYSGSYSNYVQARAGHFDFDVLWVFATIFHPPSAGWTRDVAILWDVPQLYSVRAYLNALAAAARSYRRGQTATIDSPSVTFTSNEVSFDLLPALQYVPGGAGVYLVPSGSTTEPNTWRLSFTKLQKDVLRDDMEAHYPAIRDAIKIIKHWNHQNDFGIPSFAVVCSAFWMTKSLNPMAHRARERWCRSRSQNVNWEKVVSVFQCLCLLVSDGFVPHMFSVSRDANVLPVEEEALTRIQLNLVRYTLWLVTLPVLRQ